jgi:hypothetical protein
MVGGVWAGGEGGAANTGRPAAEPRALKGGHEAPVVALGPHLPRQWVLHEAGLLRSHH